MGKFPVLKPRGVCRILVLFVLVFGWSAGLQAWPGFDWDQWWSVNTWQKLDWRTDQARRRDLAPLLGDSTSTNHIASVAAWEDRAAGSSSHLVTESGLRLGD